jgi:hypothetical protein
MSFASVSALPSQQFCDDYREGRYRNQTAHSYSGHDQQRLGPDGRPPAEPFDPTKISFNVNLSFDVPRHCCAHGPVNVTVAQNDLMTGWRKNGNKTMLTADLSRVIPTSVKIVGSTLAPQSPYALQLTDAQGMALYETHVANHSNGEERTCVGFPLFMDDKTMFRNNGVIDDNVRNYANLSWEDIKKDSFSLSYPNNGPSYVLIPKKRAFYFVWVLEVVEQGKDNILENPAYQDPGHPEYIRLFNDDYEHCMAYYKNVLSNIHFTNLTKMKATLVPLDNYHDGPPLEHKRETIVLEITGRAPELSADAASARLHGMRQSAATCGSGRRAQLDLGSLTAKFSSSSCSK